MKKQKFLVLGLPGSGKTTFLAALWAVLNNGGAAGEIELGPLSGDQRYLNRIRQLWLRYKDIGRTLPGDETEVTIPLRLRTSRQEFTFEVPELAGENYKKAWETRELPEKVADLLTHADGLALFISTKQVEKPVRMDQIRAALLGLLPTAFVEPPDEDDEDEKAAPESKPWRHEMAPTQVMLVEVLQFAEELRPVRRLSVVLSAWDEVQKKNPTDTPADWLKRELPLLWQFLQRRPGQLDVQVFAVSAQGGHYETDFDRLSQLSPVLRPKAFDDKGNELNELIDPLKWLPNPVQS